MPDYWLHTFTPFSLQHALSLAVCLGLILAACLAGARLHAQRDRITKALGIAGLIAWAIVQGWYMFPENFTWAGSLPLHVCDLAALAGPLALLTRRRPIRVLAQFWGLGLSTQGFLTPILTEGCAHPKFWLFWINHLAAIGFPTYDALTRHFKPGTKDLRNIIIASSIYGAAMAGLDAATGWNYAYVGPGTPSNPTILDALGPWPWRLIPIWAIGCTAFVFVWGAHALRPKTSIIHTEPPARD